MRLIFKFLPVLFSWMAILGCQGDIKKLTDIEGNVYKTVTIDTIVWMAENLKTTKFNDGSMIPHVTDPDEWAGLNSPAYCYYGNEDYYNKNIYGGLYNWYAVNSGKLCPTGWHISTDAEWNSLTEFLGGESVAGSKLKDTVIVWESPYEDATNEVGFAALPAGGRDLEGYFYDRGFSGLWWTSEQFYSSSAIYRMIHYDASLQRNFINKSSGMSVRCVKD